MRSTSSTVWEHMIDKMHVGDEFLTSDLTAILHTDPAATAGFLSRLRGLGVLTVVSKKKAAYVWRLHEFQDVKISQVRKPGSGGARLGSIQLKPRHLVTYDELGIKHAAPHHRLDVSPPSPMLPVSSADVIAATQTLMDSLHGLGKELHIFRREVLAATSTTELLAELMRRERHRDNH